MAKKRVYGIALIAIAALLAAPLAAQDGMEREAQDRAQVEKSM